MLFRSPRASVAEVKTVTETPKPATSLNVVGDDDDEDLASFRALAS